MACKEGIVKREAGGDRVEPGSYWSRDRWEIVPVDGATPVLPGGPADRYFRLPAPAVLVLAPAMGAAFAMFLPLIGFVMVARALASRAVRPLRRLSGPVPDGRPDTAAGQWKTGCRPDRRRSSARRT